MEISSPATCRYAVVTSTRTEPKEALRTTNARAISIFENSFLRNEKAH